VAKTLRLYQQLCPKGADLRKFDGESSAEVDEIIGNLCVRWCTPTSLHSCIIHDYLTNLSLGAVNEPKIEPDEMTLTTTEKSFR
jgi:hypothetical protein